MIHVFGAELIPDALFGVSLVHRLQPGETADTADGESPKMMTVTLMPTLGQPWLHPI